MMKIPAIFTCILSLVAYFGSITDAAEADSVISLKFQIASLEPGQNTWCFRQQDELRTVRISDRSFSPVYEYTGPPQMQFFQCDDAGSVVSTTPLASVVFPPEANNGYYLLMVSPEVSAGGGLKVGVIDKRRHLQGDNRIVVINRAGQPIRFMAGEQAIDLHPGKLRIEVVDSLEQGTFRARVLTIGDGEAYKSYESYLRIAPYSSVFIFAEAVAGKPGEIAIKTITFRDTEHVALQSPLPPAEFKKRADRTSFSEDSGTSDSVGF